MAEISILPLDTAYIEQAVSLAEAEYKAECAKNDQLMRVDAAAPLRELITGLFENGRGKMAIADGRLLGYLAFWGPWEQVHGVTKGVFSPLGGSAFDGERDRLASMLFASAAEELVKEGIFHFGISQHAHDTEIIRAFVLSGFGIRCADGIAKLSDMQIDCGEQFEIVELYGAQREQILPLRKGLDAHLNAAPIFMAGHEPENWNDREELRVFAAKDKGVYIGFMAVTGKQAETWLSGLGIYNICGAYVDPAYRGTDAAGQLLKAVRDAALEKGMTHIGVDCETLNPTALRFWGKHFANYTYGLARRVDERCGRK